MADDRNATPIPPEDERWREEQRRRRPLDEKDEKNEKEEEKSESGARDPLSTIVWALIFISAGLILLAGSTGLVNWEAYGGAWNAILFVAGLILLLEAALRLIMPEYRRSIGGTLILAFVLIGIGLSGFLGAQVIWPLVLIAIGVSFIVNALLRSRR